MTSPRRAAELRSSLVRELDSISQRAGFDGLGRLRWLRGEMENYLDRWLAFAAVESIPMKSLVGDDLFAMVLIASDFYEQQLGAGDLGVEEWRRFRSALTRVRAAKDRTMLVGLREALAGVGAALDGKKG